MTTDVVDRFEGASGATLRSLAASFANGIESRSLTIAVVGLGYAGLPLMEAFAAAGFPTLGLDVDARKVALLQAGRSPIRHIEDRRIADMMSRSGAQASTDPARLSEADAILICVPTPLDARREPDLGPLIAAADSVGRHLKRGALVVLESTTWPGASDEVLIPAIETGSGLKAGRDFATAYSPEREDPGNADFGLTSIPKIVGADTDVERAMALALYGAIAEVVPVRDKRTAEAVKLSENVFRLVNISLANELKAVFSRMGIDPWEVVDAASTKPFGYMPFHPGPGIGGHCIPVDPLYLTWKARRLGVATACIDAAEAVAAALPTATVRSVEVAARSRLGLALAEARVLVVGLAYKRNVDDCRESPAAAILDLLRRAGATTAYHDPWVPEIASCPEHPAIEGMRSMPLRPETVSGFDVAVIATDHDLIDYRLLVAHAPLTVDTRNATRRLDPALLARVVKA